MVVIGILFVTTLAYHVSVNTKLFLVFEVLHAFVIATHLGVIQALESSDGVFYVIRAMRRSFFL